MTRHTSALPCALLAVGLLGLAVPAAAQDEAFKRGIDLRENNPRAAADFFRAAVKENGQEAKRTVGRNRILLGGNPYLPYYYLGEALMKAGDCAGAVTAFETSEEQKVVEGYKEQLTNLRKWSAECAAKGILPRTQFVEQQNTVTRSVSAAGEYLNRASKLIEANRDVWQAHPEMAPHYQEAYTQYESARKGLEAANRTRLQRDFDEAKAAAGRVNTALTGFESSLKSAADAANLFLARAREADLAINGAARELEALGTGLSPALAKDLQGPRDTLSRASDRLNFGKKAQNVAAVDEARTLALGAAATIGRIRDQWRQQENEAAKRRFELAMGPASRTFDAFDSGLTRVDEMASRRSGGIAPEVQRERKALGVLVAAARRRFNAARDTGNADAVAKAAAGLEGARPRLNALLGGFGPLTLRDRGVPAVLEDGLRLFLEGEHEKVAALLSPGAIDSSFPLAAHAHLLRAGSLYTLFVRSGEKDQSLLASARQEVERSRVADSSLRPDPRVFGQRLIAFFQTATAVQPAQ